MNGETTQRTGNWHAMAEALGAFWQDAGVDRAFADDPRDWLAEAEAREAAANAPAFPPPVAPPPPRPLGPAAEAPVALAESRENWPQTLDAFAPWWLSDPALDSGPLPRRIPPRGPQNAALMVIVAEPEASDRDGLLTGEDGALLDAIERAMGLAEGGAYRAAALPRHTPAADWQAIAAAGMGAVLRHHVALAAPERLLVLSREALALLGPDEFGGDGTGHVTLGDRTIPLIAAYPLAQMRARPGYKRIFWKRWLGFSGPA